MSSNLVATPDAIRRYGDVSAAVASTVAGAAAADQAATIAAAIPVFGLIGQDFLLSFVGAQGNHVAATAELAAVFAGTAATSYDAAATYENAETESSVDFISLSQEL
ncbi:type VII secretion target [Nocardia jejuensis]|uniref:type VII secretion target n=1 Tax=Nocardia jejuensis TaxID=328049 RepID=UPI000834DCCE|nr:type VII secretion target [Nocardia jejuensis]